MKILEVNTSQDAIRDAWNSESRTLKKPYPVKVKFNGVTREFLIRQDKVASNSGKLHSVLHITVIERGRLMSGDPVEPLVKHYVLDGKNNLKNVGYPRVATDEDLAEWKKYGFNIK